jgi:hypothetical protein
MITRQQAIGLTFRDHVHFTGGTNRNPQSRPCTAVLGPKGGVKVNVIDCRVNGSVQTWKTRPTEFRVPIKYGMREYGEINHTNAEHWHLASECDEKYMQTLCYACGWTSGADWTHDHLIVNGKPCRNAVVSTPPQHPRY